VRSLLLALLVLALSSVSSARGVNTDVALPVAEGEGIWRSQLRFTRATDDPTPRGREARLLIAPQTLVLGVTPRLTAFATLEMLAGRRVESRSGSTRADPALGDLTLLGRYTLFWDDYAPLSTRRSALLAGVKLPTGANRFGTETFDPLLGGLRDLGLRPARDRRRRSLHGVDAPQRLSPGRSPALRPGLSVPSVAAALRQAVAAVECPARAGRSVERSGRGAWPDGGGLRGQVALAPGLQLAAKTWMLEASLQLPIAQDHGSQIEQDFVMVLSLRVPFAFALPR
jgi:hypothetical protein